ncbi:MAG: molybdopterin-dependent oxidoreductase [Candidatus Schekmanbacteria bacterium]|nr:molybdopterin-dependent oxidoreductase [Candidatus Schekmanbacteria bacterium]
MKKHRNIKRRSFLKASGAASATALGGCQKIKNVNKGIHEFLNRFEEVPVPHGIETWKTTTCNLCSSSCGIRARTIDGRLVSIEGNSAHPVNRGGICPRGVNGLHILYNPNRLSGPMKKTGSGDSSKWERISWDDAMKAVTGNLKSLRTQSPQSLMFLHGKPSTSLEVSFADRFMQAYGSPNYICYMDGHDYYDSSMLDAIYLMQGINAAPSYDIGNSNFVLSFNTDIFESHENLMQSLKAYGQAHSERPSGRCRFVHVGPRLSASASTADKWIPVRPGTEGVLALGVAHVIIREDLYDYNFVNINCSGFEDRTDESGKTERGFKSVVMSEYAPSDVSNMTGVKVEEIIRLARDFASSRPALAVGNRTQTRIQLAVHSLNALLGSINTKGGILFPPDIVLKKEGEKSSSIYGENNTDFLSKIISSPESPVKALFIKNANPIYSSLESALWRKALDKIPFKVSFSGIMDETSSLCDMILPDCTYLEKWNGSAVATSEGYQVFSISRPVVEPVVECKASEDVLLNIASGLSPEVAINFHWKSFSDYVELAIEGLFEAGRGSRLGEEFEGTWVRLLEKAGWRIPSEGGLDEFKKTIIDAGGWWDPIYYYGELSRVILKPTGKFELMPAIKSMTNYSFPELTETDETREQYFALHVSKPASLAALTNPNSPWMLDNITSVLTDRWNTWIEINEEIAKKLGFKRGDEVIVESDKGKIRAEVTPTKSIHPEFVSIPAGMGHVIPGEWSNGIGSNAADIMSAVRDPVTGIFLADKTKVKIYKA